MLSFENDYSVGAHPAILKKLCETNLEPQPGYGYDAYCEAAKKLIQKEIGDERAQVYFLSGGTQTNALAISAMLKPYEGVICADTGHIAGHEAGAIEYTGHKVILLPQKEGKIEAAALEVYLKRFFGDENREHMVSPGLVYLSWPTEYGTIYSKAQLEEIASAAHSFGLRLYIDGARLGYGLCADGADLTLPELAALCDAFYIGGTKVGALLGEALVFPRGGAPEHFFTLIKQHGALLSKGRVLGVQFEALFKDGLYYELGRNAIAQAKKLRAILHEKGYRFFLETPTNQQFVLLEDAQFERLRREVSLAFWEKPDAEHTVVRFAVSWSTQDQELEALRAFL